MPIEIDPHLLAALSEHCAEAGNSSIKTVSSYLETKDSAIVAAYRAALAPAVQPPVIRLLNPDNTLIELEIVRSKENDIVVKIPVPTDFVEVLVKGEIVKVDALQVDAEAAKLGIAATALRTLIAHAR